jgi:hypothetical protein
MLKHTSIEKAGTEFIVEERLVVTSVSYRSPYARAIHTIPFPRSAAVFCRPAFIEGHTMTIAIRHASIFSDFFARVFDVLLGEI